MRCWCCEAAAGGLRAVVALSAPSRVPCASTSRLRSKREEARGGPRARRACAKRGAASLTFRVEATDGAARAGVLAPRTARSGRPRSCPSARRRRSRSLHPDEVRALGAAGHPRQHLPPALPARRGRDRGARRPARVLRLGRADPHRLGRLPGLLAPRHDRSRRRRRRHVPLGLRRRRRRASRPSASPRSSAARLRHRDVPRRLPAGGCVRDRARGGRAAHDALGRAAGRRGRARRASSSSGSRRAEPTPSSAAARSRRSPRSASTATRSAASRSARNGRRCSRRVDWAAPLLPAGQPRYFMGIGDPEGILEVIARGIDMFDCVLPTRTARTGSALTWRGTAQPAQRPLRPRSAAARGGLRLPGVRALLARVHPPPRQPAGDARPAAAQPA